MALFCTAARIAAREVNRPKPANQKPVEWQPFTKCVWIFFLFAVPIEAGGAWRVGAFVILGAIVFSVLAVLVWALGKSATQRGEEKDPVAAYLDEQEAKR